MNITLTEIMNGPWKERSIATCEDRGIPHIVDGMKPVQRFLVYQGFKTAKNKSDKVSAIAGAIAALGYEHGEVSAAGALTSMTAYFSNNLPLFLGDGNFGNRLDGTPSAPRYIKAQLAPYISDILKDTEFSPENPDPEISTPLYYLPIIPMCLVNGVSGIATGYAVDIPPHSVVSIIDNLIRLADGKQIKDIKPKYYNFSGTVEKNDDHYVLTGTYEKKSPIHYVVTDLPPIFYDSASYEAVLRKMVDKGDIVSFENYSCDDNFKFDIWLKKGTRWDDNDVVKNLKLSCKHNWNLTTIMPNGKLKVWDKLTGIEDILIWFYNFRIEYVQKRIDTKKNELIDIIAYYKGFLKFLEDVVNRKLKLKDITEEDFYSILKDNYEIPEKYVDKVMNSPVRTFSVQKMNDIRNKLESAISDLEYFNNTTKEIEYKKDLENLKKIVRTMEK